ncbi:MAG: SPOR domain-containing protein, partial [Pseudomonadota bacterium]
ASRPAPGGAGTRLAAATPAIDSDEAVASDVVAVAETSGAGTSGVDVVAAADTGDAELDALRSGTGQALDEEATALQGDVYLQAGVFTAQSYGYRLRDNLAKVGIAADVLPTTFLGREAIRVRAGPFGTAEERQSALAELRRLGINDALPVSQ